MAGPYSSDEGVDAGGPPYTEHHPSESVATQPAHGPYTAPPPREAMAPVPTYPGMPSPPAPGPKHHRRRLIIGALVTLVLVGTLTAVVVSGVRANRSTAGAEFTDKTVEAVIQGYLDALENRDVDTIARNSLCGIYDAVRDRRADRAVAKLSSDAFRKQFSRAEVTSVDKIVYWSRYQAQVLFSMRVTPAGGGPTREHVQGIAQLLFEHHDVLVCSYVLRTAGTY